MTDITKEMQKLIADNLPAATAGAMSDFIVETKRLFKNFISSPVSIVEEISGVNVEFGLSLLTK